MSDLDPGQHDEIARRLRDEGLAQAPPDVAEEVMRRVRSEPRHRTSRMRRPLVNLLAAAVIIAALLVGVAKLGGGGSGSASGGSVAETSSGNGINGGAATAKAPGIAKSAVIDGVPYSALRNSVPAATLGPVYHQAMSMCANDRIAQRRGVTLFVPDSSWSAVQQQLQSAKTALLPSDTLRVRVRLRRVAAGAATAYSLTCP
jgi:hypothetical protein